MSVHCKPLQRRSETTFLVTGNSGACTWRAPAGGQQAVATVAQQWQEAAAQMLFENRNLSYTGSRRSSGTTTARRDLQPGGYATAGKTRVLRRRHCCYQKLCVCLFCTAWLTLGAIGEIGGIDTVLDTAVQHAGNCTNTSGERWSTGGPGGMEMLGSASRTDFADPQCRSAARALELQLRGRD